MKPRAPLAAALTLLLAGCAGGGAPEGVGRVTAAATTDTYSIRVGNCTGKLDTETTDKLALVPCTDKHHWEAFAVSNLPGDDFPGNAEVRDQATKACTPAFESFIGIASEDSRYELTLLTPTKETWTQAGDREVVCLVGSSSGGLTGSLKGVAE